jgi:hypothetical protein
VIIITTENYTVVNRIFSFRFTNPSDIENGIKYPAHQFTPFVLLNLFLYPRLHKEIDLAPFLTKINFFILRNICRNYVTTQHPRSKYGQKLFATARIAKKGF